MAYRIVAADRVVADRVVVDKVVAAVVGHILGHMVVERVPLGAAVAAHMVAAHRMVARMRLGVAHTLVDLDRSS